MKQWKRIICVVEICALVLSCLGMTGCQKIKDFLTGKLQEEADRHEMVATVCKASDFNSVKDDWFGLPSLLSKEAKAIATNEVVMGETYYIVLSLHGFTEGNGGTLSVSLRSWGQLYCGSNAVSLDDSNIVVNGNIEWTYDASQNSEQKDVLQFSCGSGNGRRYIAIPFTPKQTGILYIDCTTDAIYTESGLYQVESHLCSTVKNVAGTEGTAEITIANLSYGVLSQQAYESGKLEGVTDLASVSDMSAGQNYLVVDFDIVSESDVAGELYCGFYVHRGNWSNAVLEAANTAKSIENDYYGGKFFDFAYTSLPNGQKKVRILLGFTAPEAGAIDFEFFAYADQALMSGTTQACGSVVDSGASRLTYRLDEDQSAYYVTGYETMTGMVVIPEYYQGYPVIGVEKEAFADCGELTTLNLNKISEMPDSALEGCTGLDISDPSSVEMNVLRQFPGSWDMGDVINYKAPSGGLPDVYKVTQSPRRIDLGKKYYWMVDLYVSQNDAKTKNLSFSLRSEHNINCSIVLKQAIGTGVWCQTSEDASDITIYIMQAQRTTKVRLIFEVTPYAEGTGDISFWIAKLWEAQSVGYSFRIQ